MCEELRRRGKEEENNNSEMGARGRANDIAPPKNTRVSVFYPAPLCPI